MSEIQNDSNRDRHSKVRMRKRKTAIDMTPMVDLAFLLLTFFILTTSFKSSRFIDLQMPDKPKDNSNKISEDQALNIILLDSNRIKWYVGMEDKAVNMQEAFFNSSDSTNIKNVIRKKNQFVETGIKFMEDSIKAGLIPNDTSITNKKKKNIENNNKAMVILIKPDDKSSYQTLISLLDVISVSNVLRYSVMDVSLEESRQAAVGAASSSSR